MTTALKSGQTLVFIGDSITDCERREPAHAPLGQGFVRRLYDLLIVREPAKTITLLNRGIGGNTVDDLRSRWHDDVLLHRPDWLVVKIGINDLNQFLCQPERAFLSPEGYSAIYDTLLVRTRRALPETRLMLLSPFFLSTDATEGSYRAKTLGILPAYIDGVRTLAQTHGARFVDLHALFQERLRLHHPDVYCPEPVHPNATGHLVIAEAVYTALGA